MLVLLLGCALFDKGDDDTGGPPRPDSEPEDTDVVDDTDTDTGPKEDCTDGEDNDDDGLIDCEDGNCAGTASCGEDCTDGEDDDRDGLTDCGDDDCIGTIYCPLVEVTGGTLQHTLHIEPLPQGNRERRSHDVVLRDVVGQVQFSNTTCDWGFASGTWQHRKTTDKAGKFVAETLDPLQRTGFTIDNGCALTHSGFLPQRVMMFGLGAQLPVQVSTAATTSPNLEWEPLAPWYVGPLTFSSSVDYGANAETFHWTQRQKSVTASGYAREPVTP